MRDATQLALTALAMSLAACLSPLSAAAQEMAPAPAESANVTATQVADWVTASGDNRGLPFVIVDKVAAQVFVFGGDGRLLGAEPALLGFARGDDSVPGIGDRRMSAIRPNERTTPAGRFVAGFGPASGGHSVLWVDFDTAISMHPVVTGNPKERRLERLKSASGDDNRITYGCINVSAAFYRNVVRGAFTGTSGVVYILPETKPVEQVFPAFRLQPHVTAGEPGEELG